MFNQPVSRVLKFTLLCVALVGTLTACATPTEAECDPADDAFLNSLKCRGHYQNRQDKLEEEVRQAAERAAQKEQELAHLDTRRIEINKQLERLQGDLQTRLQRISALQSNQSATEAQLAELQVKWDSVKQETDELSARQVQVSAPSQLNEFDEQLAQLRKEEAELEALLLDLES